MTRLLSESPSLASRSGNCWSTESEVRESCSEQHMPTKSGGAAGQLESLSNCKLGPITNPHSICCITIKCDTSRRVSKITRDPVHPTSSETHPTLPLGCVLAALTHIWVPMVSSAVRMGPLQSSVFSTSSGTPWVCFLQYWKGGAQGLIERSTVVSPSRFP